MNKHYNIKKLYKLFKINIIMPIQKKRGRKPKGGKIIQNDTIQQPVQEDDTNIILHLKCKSSDLDKILVHTIKPYEKNNKYSEYNSTKNVLNEKTNIKEKINDLSFKLHNNIINKLSNCFWCTYPFENQPFYIPKNIDNKEYKCYGCFCSPECATSFLFKQNIESSFKFERYHLLNSLYNKNTNIKPAPDPYYTLEKYYGNLSIEEYREHLKSDNIMIVIDKPISIILPGIHIENHVLSDNITNEDTKYVMRKSTQPKDKKKIINEHFGI